MKKYTIKLQGGQSITIWAENQQQAIEKAGEQYPSMLIVSVQDNSPMNPVNIPERPAIQWNKFKLEMLKMDIAKNEELNHNTFYFEGHELDVKYAKYLAEYLTTQLL